MIEFGNPWLLLGLLAVAVPLWLHLFGRRRAPVVYFSALDFVLAANPKRARALQWRHWLLLSVRAAAIFLLVLALARPSVPVLGAAGELQVGSGPQAVVAIIDDSESMGAVCQGEPCVERARRRAMALISALPAGSRAAVVASGFPARPLLRQLTGDRQALLSAIAQLPAKPRRDDAAKALALASAMLDSAVDVPKHRIVVLSDLQADGWRQAVLPAPAGGAAAPQLAVDRTIADHLENTAITDVSVDRTSDGVGAQARLEVTLRHFGSKAWRDYVSVKAGDREVKTMVQLQPGETARRSFVLPAASPWAEIALPADALAADNRRMVRLDAGSALRVAVINGAPRPVPRDDETFFVTEALQQAGGGSAEIAVDLIPADKLNAAALADDDVAIAANLAQPTPEVAAALGDFARHGGGLLVAMGDNYSEDAGPYLPAVLPASLAGVRAVAGGDAPEAGLNVLLAGTRGGVPNQVARELRARLGDLQDLLGQPKVQRCALVAPDAALAERTVLRLSDGTPLLLAAQVGAGRVALLTTTIDRDWTDLPLQPVYLPMLAAVVGQLAGPHAMERRSAVAVGEPVLLSRDDRADQLEIKPEGDGDADRPRKLLAAALQHGGQWTVADLDTPGRYVATELRNGVALTSRPLLVVPPTTESDLAPAADGPLAKLAAAAPDRAAANAPKSPAWTAVLLVLLTLLLGEAAVLARAAQAGSWRRA